MTHKNYVRAFFFTQSGSEIDDFRITRVKHVNTSKLENRFFRDVAADTSRLGKGHFGKRVLCAVGRVPFA